MNQVIVKHSVVSRMSRDRDIWPTWKFALGTFRELEDLWELVKPVTIGYGSMPAIDERKFREARANIMLLLDPVNYVRSCDAWMKLEAEFEDTRLTRRLGLLRNLYDQPCDMWHRGRS